MTPEEIAKTANQHLEVIDAAKASTATSGQTNSHSVLKIILHALSFLFNIILNHHVPPTPDNPIQSTGSVGSAATSGTAPAAVDGAPTGSVAGGEAPAVGDSQGSGTPATV